MNQDRLASEPHPISQTRAQSDAEALELTTRLEEALQQVEQLQGKCSKLESDLQQAQQSALHTDRKNHEFHRLLAHKIRNPLHVIQSAVELLEGSALEADQAGDLGLIKSSSKRILNTLEELIPVTMPAINTRPAAATNRGNGMNVLCVDDHPEIRELTKILLEREGYSVVTAEDGAEALHRYETQKPDLILMDIRMPGVDGIEATRRIRETEKQTNRPRVPIIAVTASISEEDPVALELNQWDGCLHKPVPSSHLLREVRKALAAQAVA